jgi:hypothetical protein
MRAKHFVDFINQGAELDKITYEEYQRKLLDETLTDEEILKYSKIIKGEGAFDWDIVADPEKVLISEEDQQIESAMKIGNTLSRWRRAMPDLKDWNNEIHGTSDGFAKVAERFKSILTDVI